MPVQLAARSSRATCVEIRSVGIEGLQAGNREKRNIGALACCAAVSVGTSASYARARPARRVRGRNKQAAGAELKRRRARRGKWRAHAHVAAAALLKWAHQLSAKSKAISGRHGTLEAKAKPSTGAS